MADLEKEPTIKPTDLKEKRQAKIKMIATSKHPFIKENEEFEIHPVHEKDLNSKKWAFKKGDKVPDLKDAAVPLSHEEANKGTLEAPGK